MIAQAPPARRARRSWWGWAVGAAVVLFVVSPVVAVAAVVQLLSSTAESSNGLNPRAVQPYPHVDLDTSLGVGWGSAIWSVSDPGGWDFRVLDRSGVNRADDSALECTWTTRQMTRSNDMGEYGDRLASTHGIEQLVEKFGGSAPAATVAYLLPMAVPFRTDDHSGSAEFLTARIDDVDVRDGTPRSTLVAARAMPFMSEFMYTALTCPSEKIDADPTMWVHLVAGTVIVPSP